MKSAFVTGVTGQDGVYLAVFLSQKALSFVASSAIHLFLILLVSIDLLKSLFV